jgi:hypothetical protein
MAIQSNQPVKVQLQIRLDRIEDIEPGLSPLVRYYQKREILYQSIRIQPLAYQIDLQAGRLRLQTGTPIFQEGDFPFSSPVLRELWTNLSLAMSSPELTRLAFGEPEEFHSILAFLWSKNPRSVQIPQGFDKAKVLLLAQDTLRPFLQAWRGELQAEFIQEVEDWQRPICPYCGSQPLFAELQGTQASRHLRCGLCGSDWPYPRLRCALCGEENYRNLGLLSLEEESSQFSIQTCDTCGRYIKTIHTFEPIPQELLPCEDIETLYLDNLANQAGFFRFGVEENQLSV